MVTRALAVWECSTPLHRKGAAMSLCDVPFKFTRDRSGRSHYLAVLGLLELPGLR
jgi:hypothetical protein